MLWRALPTDARLAVADVGELRTLGGRDETFVTAFGWLLLVRHGCSGMVREYARNDIRFRSF